MRRGHARPRTLRQGAHHAVAARRQRHAEGELPAIGLDSLELRAQQVPVAAPQARAVVRHHRADAARLVPVARPRDHDRLARRQAGRRRSRLGRDHPGPDRQRAGGLVQPPQLGVPAIRRTARHGGAPVARRHVGIDRQQRRRRILEMTRRRHPRPRAARQRARRAKARLRQRHAERQIAILRVERLEDRPQREPLVGLVGRRLVAGGRRVTARARHRPDAARPVRGARPGDDDRIAGAQAVARLQDGRRQDTGPDRQRPGALVERHQLASPPVGLFR